MLSRPKQTCIQRTIYASIYLLVASLSVAVNAKEKLDARIAFERLTSLVGVWHKSGVEIPKLEISFELIANKSVLVETWLNRGKKHSFTLYHIDNSNLMATHYCPQGNQPRLLLANSSTLDDLTFEFLDVTNLENPSDPHQHALGFNFFKNVNKITRRETYSSGDGKNQSSLHLVRSKQP